jgi:hypothetical protein
MSRRVVGTLTALLLLAGCSNAASPAAAQPSPSTLPAAGQSPVPSPTAARDPLIVFVKRGSVALATADGQVLYSAPTPMDSGEIALGELGSSDAALIGHYWGADGIPLSPLAIGLLDRSGAITDLDPAAANFFGDVGVWGSPVVFNGHDALLVRQSSVDAAQYIKLDLLTGDFTVLLTVTKLPVHLSASDGATQAVSVTPLGTSPDASVARVMVKKAVVDGQPVPGAAYFEIDLRTSAVTGPRALPDIGPVAISADGRYIAWTLWTPVSGSKQRDLYIRDLVTGHESTIYNVRFLNEEDRSGIHFSPDDAYVALEGYGSDSFMGFEVYNVATNDLVRVVPASERDTPDADVPLWWAGSNTIVYQTTDASGVQSGHRLDLDSGEITDYAADMGVPVLILS